MENVVAEAKREDFFPRNKLRTVINAIFLNKRFIEK